MNTRDGKFVLNLAHLRAGHWPGVHAPPWAINLPLLELSMGRMLLKRDSFEAFVPASSSEFIPVVIKHMNMRSMGESGFYAIPTRTEDAWRWKEACRRNS